MDEWDFILPDRPSQYDQERKRKRNSSNSVKEEALQDLWVDKYAPKNENDICVQATKVKETKQAISHSAIGDRLDPTKILLLSGPTGCGKSTLVRILCHSLNLELIEWQNPVNERDAENKVHTMTLFTRFLNSSIRRDTMHNSSQKKLVFVDDIPDITTDRVKSDFHSCLKSCLESSIPFLLVLVVSDAWMERSSSYSTSFGEKLNRVTDIIPKELEDDRRVRHIKYNAVSPGNMKKVLNKIMNSEHATLPKNQLQDILDQSDGDIRAAINNVQFYAIRSLYPSSKRKSSSSRQSNVVPFDEKIGPLDLFHAVGKVLYAKRNPDGTLESKPEHILNKIPVDNDIFISFLHQNSLYFFDDIESCAKSMDYLSVADTIRSHVDWQENTSSSYRNLVTMHGIMSKPPRSSASRYFSMQKPYVYDIRSTIRRQQSENYHQQLLQSVKYRCDMMETEELKELDDDPIEDFSEDEFDDIFGDGSDLALLDNF